MTPTDDVAPSGPAPTVTRLEKRWLLRMLLILVLFAGFGLWGFYDATIAYPARGRQVADHYLFELLRMKLEQPAWSTAEVGTADPRAERSRLAEKIESRTATEFDQARYRWLEALRLVGDLDQSHTVITNPLDKRRQLEAQAAARPPNQSPKPLSPWDIPAQWLIFVGCSAVALYVLVLLFAVGARRYTWDPATRRLGLPGGHALVPTDIVEFDKRKWHKFIVLLRVRPDHPTLGGRAVKLDLYCHTSLESWVLEMEKAAGPPPDAESLTPNAPNAPAAPA